jgi:hypothetical protein
MLRVKIVLSHMILYLIDSVGLGILPWTWNLAGVAYKCSVGSRSNAEFVAAPSMNRGASNTPPSGTALSTISALLDGGAESANDDGSVNGGSAGGGSPSPMNETAARVLTRPTESTPLNDKIDLNSVRIG